MIARLPLSGRIFILAFVNLLLLAAVFLVFAHYQFHLDLGTFLFAPAQDRVLSVTREVAVDLEQTPSDARTGLMGRYAVNYGVDFYLFSNEGEQLAGRPVTLPPDVAGQLLHGPPPRDREGPPPGVLPDVGPPPPPPPERDGRGRGRGRGDNPRYQIFQLSSANLYWVGARIPVRDPAGGQPLHGTLIMAARSFYGTPLLFDYKPWLAALGASVAIFLLCWLPFIRGLTRTISQVTRATERIAEGDFDHHLSEDRGDELGQLASAINRLASRLAGFVGGQKRFLGDIAHELCAPIARIQFGLGILEHRAEESQRAAVEDVSEEVRHMSTLVEELLSFSKAGMESKDRPLKSVDVIETARQAVTREATGRGDIRIETDGPVTAMADPDYLLRALSNLVRNAVRYAADAGPITISARRDAGDVVIDVADCGPGLPQEELDRVFTPFYRLEASRNRAMGGAGLGLAIVKSCVEACRGRVECRNRRPSGLEVQIRLQASR